jgi:amidase
MDAEDLAFAGIARQAEMVRAGEVSPRELVELYLERIERLDPRLNAFRKVLGDRALADAERAERRRAAGEGAPLLGIPIAIKDNVAIAGEVTTYGTGAYGLPASEDSVLVRRLREAGAIPIGITNMPELAIYGFTESKTWGVTRNPWDLSRTPGGSSGGAGAATAAGLCAAAHATDGAGSIRFPAANCGLLGLKPQRGRVPLGKESWHGLSVSGCVTRSVLDTALYLDAVAEPGHGDPDAPPSWKRPLVETARAKPGPLRICWSIKTGVPVRLDREVRRGLDETLELLRSLGHRVERRDPEYGFVFADFYPRYTNGAAVEAARLSHPERLESRSKGFARMGRLVGRRVQGALEREARHAARINRIFEHCDVLLTPTTARPPAEVGRWEGKGAMRTNWGMVLTYPYAAIWNYTGQPAAAVPAGFTADGLPLSVQLIGRPGDEPTLVSLAAQIEAERPWTERRPPIS